MHAAGGAPSADVNHSAGRGRPATAAANGAAQDKPSRVDANKPCRRYRRAGQDRFPS